MSTKKTTYRKSHTAKGYGAHYQKTYTSGYYAILWDNVEKPLVKSVFEDIKTSGAKKCLDFACGTGRITAVAEDVFETVVGVDISADMLSVANKKLSRVRLIEQDITSHPLKEQFDVISSFRFFLNAEHQLSSSVLKSMYKMLEEDGTLVVNVHVNKWSLLGVVYRLRNSIGGRVTANTLGWKEFSKTLNAAGFHVVQTKWYGFYPRTGWMFSSVAKVCLFPFEKLCNASGLFPKRWAQNFIVVCKKTNP